MFGAESQPQNNPFMFFGAVASAALKISVEQDTYFARARAAGVPRAQAEGMLQEELNRYVGHPIADHPVMAIDRASQRLVA